MSIVYRADDEALERKVALKLLAPELAEDDRFRERFLRESKLAASIEHPHIIPVYDAGEADGLLYIAMRYVEGRDLKTMLRADACLEPMRAVELLTQVASALDAAHARGLVHRDVKPSNVLVAPGDHAYLADFGLTKSVSDRSSLTITGRVVGTVDYVAPEQVEGKRIDGRADVYSLGCVLYECLTGELPFPRDSELAALWAHVQEPPPRASARRSELPPALDGVVVKAMAKSPEDRYSTCGELTAAARAAIAPAVRPRRRVRGSVRGKRLVLAAVLAVAAAAVAATLLTRGTSSVSPLTSVDSLARIDPRTGRLVAATAVTDPVAVAAGNGSVWIADGNDRTVSRLDPRTGKITRSIDVGALRRSMIVDPLALALGGNAVAVGSGPDGEVVLLRPGAPAQRVELGEENVSTATVATAFGAGSFWAATALDQTIWRIDPRTGHVVRRIPLEPRPSALAYGSHRYGQAALWVASSDGAVLEIDPVTNRVVTQLELPFVPGGIAFGAYALWLTDPSRNAVVRLDVPGNVIGQTSRTFKVGRGPSGIAFGAGSVWVGNSGDGTVSRIDPTTQRVVGTVRVGPRPGAIAVGADGVWVAVHAH
jgi:serine/threonine-protein kinase